MQYLRVGPAMSAAVRRQERCLGPRGREGAVRPRCLLLRASAVKEERKSTSGRKGEGKTGSSRTPPGTASGRRDGSSSASNSPSGTSSSRQPQPPPKALADRRKEAAPQQRQQGRASSSSSTGKAASPLDAYVRRHPVLNRFHDGTLLLGDCVMILATEASSERIEWSSYPVLVGVLLGTWVAAGAWNGDYSPAGSRAHQDVPWQLAMLGPTYGSILGAALTWAFASTASLGAYAALVADNALDAAPVVEGLNTEDLSPQLEVIVALLITMACWRGIASKLRPTYPGQE